MANHNIGKNIAELRKSKGITQEALAEVVGVTAQAVSKWESGGTPDVELLIPIADYFGISIDRLFGRNVNDYGDIETEAAKLAAGAGHDKAISKAFELCWAVERGICGTTVLEPHDSLDAILGKETGYVHSQMLYDNGITLMALQKELQYFLIMPEPECGWLKELGAQEEYLKLFKLLADSDILKSLYLLYSRVNKPFTPKLLEKELGIATGRAIEVLDILTGYKLIHTSEIELDDEVQKVYNFNPNPAFIAVLAICKEMIQKPNSFYWNNSSRSKPYLKK